MTDTHLTQTRFDSFNLAPAVLDALAELGFACCTPIQAKTLPYTLAPKDVCGQAQTGTGKTVAFLVSIFNLLINTRDANGPESTGPYCVILAPTRELAVQISNEAEVFARHAGMKQIAVYGGTGYDSQKKALQEGVDVIIGTPGRIIDYHQQKVFNFRKVKVLVIDEADRMFDLGFIRDIRYVLRRTPPMEQRLTMLFSATLSFRVKELAYEHMNNPEHVTIEPTQVTGSQITEQVYFPAQNEKIPLLLGLLQANPEGQVLVFVNTKHTAEKVVNYINGNGFTVALMTGDIPQKKRQRLLAEFADGSRRVMVATDVAARGLHIPAVSHVINFDLPQDAEDYVHRIGRTGRAGATGTAISFACEKYAFHLPEIETYIGHKLGSLPVSAELLVKPAPPKELIAKSERVVYNSGAKKGDGGRKRQSRGRNSKRSAPRREKSA